MNSHFDRVLQGMTAERFGDGLRRELSELHSNVTSAGAEDALRTACQQAPCGGPLLTRLDGRGHRDGRSVSARL